MFQEKAEVKHFLLFLIFTDLRVHGVQSTSMSVSPRHVLTVDNVKMVVTHLLVTVLLHGKALVVRLRSMSV